MRGLATIAWVAGLVVLALAGCSDDRTPSAVRSAYAELEEDPLWTATPPGFERTNAQAAKCQASIHGGLDDLTSYQMFVERGPASATTPVEFYRARAAEEGWRDLGTGRGRTELVLETERDGATWNVQVGLDPGRGGIPATVELRGRIDGIDICADES